MYIRQVREAGAVDVRSNALDAAQRIYADILINFDFDGSEQFAKIYREILDQFASRKRSGTIDLGPMHAEGDDDSLDLPV